VSTRNANSAVAPNMERLQRDVRELATGLNSRINSLETLVVDGEDGENNAGSLAEIAALNNLKSCVRSAATIVSSASTILDRDRETTYLHSEFGDVFMPDTNDTMLEWISSSALISTVSTSDDVSQPQQLAQAGLVVKSTQMQFPAGDVSDSDSDLDAELALGLYRKAQVKFRACDYQSAEPLLRNCLSRLKTTTLDSSVRINSKRASVLSIHEVLALLCQTCMRLQKWDEAASAMMDKIALTPRGLDTRDEAGLNDISALVTILYAKKDYVQGHLYARKLLRGYRRLGTNGADGIEGTLILLVEICKASGNTNEGEAYAIMLEDVLEKKAAEAAEAAAAAAEPSQESPSLEENVESPAVFQTSAPEQLQITDGLGSHHHTEAVELPAFPPETNPPEEAILQPPQTQNTVIALTEYPTEPLLPYAAFATRSPPSNTRIVTKKLVIVGDGMCGKTLLL